MRALEKSVDYLKMQGKWIGNSKINNILASGWFLLKELVSFLQERQVLLGW